MIKMQCPLNKNVNDNFGCDRCHKTIGRESTRAKCVISSRAKYIKEEPIEPDIKEPDGAKKDTKPGRVNTGRRKKNTTSCP